MTVQLGLTAAMELPARLSISACAETRYRDELLRCFGDKIAVNRALSRALVSWQSNRGVAGFRWFKYKEGFSVALVRYLLDHLKGPGVLLDPFAGTGVAPITAAGVGWKGIGIEILPVAARFAKSWVAATGVSVDSFRTRSAQLLGSVRDTDSRHTVPHTVFPHLRITERAFSAENEVAIAAARGWLAQSHPSAETDLLDLAAMAALEDASWTSKDGQYLRWDHRSGRRLKARMEKRRVLSYADSLRNKIDAIAADLPAMAKFGEPGDMRIISDSCYDALPQLPDNSIDGVITSPPYANRYDYTRTYALELAWLGYDNESVGALRQRLLSATVENRSKRQQLEIGHSDAIALFDKQLAVREITAALEAAKESGELPNPHVIRLVQNYFMEMAVVIAQLARVCKPGASVFMVNDNVQYHGQEVPVDLILSDLAGQCGFRTKAIWTLASGKGNASQQMGRFGRKELRKCVYWWVKR